MHGIVDVEFPLALEAKDRRGGELFGERRDAKRCVKRVGRLRIEMRETERAFVDGFAAAGNKDGSAEAGFGSGGSEELVDARPEEFGVVDRNGRGGRARPPQDGGAG